MKHARSTYQNGILGPLFEHDSNYTSLHYRSGYHVSCEQDLLFSGLFFRSLGDDQPEGVYRSWNPAQQGEDQVNPKVRAKADDKKSCQGRKKKSQ